VGNLWEWCEDIWDEEAYKKRAQNGLYEDHWVDTSFDKTSLRIMRGGSSYSKPEDCRITVRNFWDLFNQFSDHGFRLVFSFSVQRPHEGR
jgi:formylglycine-generating enzyme required for sulfatase activity